MDNGNNNLMVSNIGMNKRQVEFIDGITREIRFSGSKKPSRSCVLNTFLKIAMALELDVSGIKSEKDIEERFFKALTNGARKAR